MARTAPIPNIPAIPGMNPGVWVMGGGGNAGGSNGKNGKGNAGKQGANGNNGGNGANGGGKGAGTCGPGSGGGCMNPVHGNRGTHAGDPVDPISGCVYTIAQADLVLTGAFPLRIERSYISGAAEQDLGLGFGWSHSLAWRIETRRRTLVVRRPNGSHAHRDIPAVGDSAWVADGVRLTRDAGGYVITEGRLVYVFSASSQSNARFLLTAVVDHNGNRVSLVYEGDTLVALLDTAGRTIRVQRHADGRIRAFEIEGRSGRKVTYRSYQYDEHGDLVATLDAAGRRIEYVYQDHLLTRVRYPSGLATHYRYDEEARCIETWCDHLGAPDPALADDVPALLADGVTPAKGVLHARMEYGPDFTVVYDSRQSRRFDHSPNGKPSGAAGVWTESVDYDALGNVTAHHDAAGGSTRYGRDADGRVLTEKNALGQTNLYAYDPAGNLVEAIDALGASVAYSYDDKHNLLSTRDALGTLLSFVRDEQGRASLALMPNGGETRFEYDAEGNLAKLTEPNGRSRVMRYDEVGRLVAFHDEEGHETVLHYDPCGTLIGVTQPTGARPSVELDADGRVSRYFGGDGSVYELCWGGYNVVHELRKPNGDSLRLRYDRECNLVEVVNEAGERYRCERDVAGRVVGEESFDGRRYGYKLDGSGRIQRIKNAVGEEVILERDAAGRLVRRSFADDAFEAFEYDPVGRLVVAETKESRVEYTYDERGNLVQETQTCDGVTSVVKSAFDGIGRRVSVQTTGYALRTERDRMGLPSRIALDGGDAVAITHDGLGREILRAISDKCHVVTRYDGLGQMLERRVTNGAAAPVGPQWVGRLPPGTIVNEGFAYGADGDLVEHVDSAGVRTAFAYDPLHRVTERRTSTGTSERYRYGDGGRVYPAGNDAPTRSFGRGGVVLRDGESVFEIDGEGRRVRAARGEAASSLRWGARGMLDRQTLPDGTRIDHVYDAHARRLVKRVVRPEGEAVITRFVWSGDQLIQEHSETYRAGQKIRVSSVDYAYRDDAVAPFAHRETVGGAEPGPWIHYLLGSGNAPSILVSASGEVLAEARTTIWGDLRWEGRARTPWGFAGMYRDEETGLFYQRYRFYDPVVGQYLSPDPLGISASLNAWEYAHAQPLRVIDPLGLAPVTTTVTGTAGTATANSGGQVPEIHPVVAAAIPPRHPNAPGGIYPRGNTQSPTACGEPRALSDYLRQWESQHNNGQQLNPNNSDDHPKIQQALASIGNISSSDDKGARAPCPNCSQMIANLQNRWGAPNPNGPNTVHPDQTLVTPGATSRGGTDNTNFSPPSDSWAAQQRQNPLGGGMPPFGPADPNQNRPATGPAQGPWNGYDEAGQAHAEGRLR
ncbi:Rhs-family protein [Minicystis rosea]|nr:Rhs-family protein [Minicystis rosea]